MRLLFLWIILIIGAQAATNIWINAGNAYGVEPRLLYAISKVESNLEPYCISISYKRLSKQKKETLYKLLKEKDIPHYTYTQVIEVKGENLDQAKTVINFLDKNNFPNFDIGLMQINNYHKKSLARRGISLEKLLDEDVNLKVASGILWYFYKKHGSYHEALNGYNGRVKKNPYSKKVFAVLKKLLLPHEKTSKRLFYSAI